MWTVRITWREFEQLMQGVEVKKTLADGGHLRITEGKGDSAFVLTWVPAPEDAPAGRV